MARLTTEYATKARDLQARHAAAREQITSNADLSADGVKRQLAEMDKQRRNDVTKLRTEERTALTVRRAVLEKQLYGLNSTDPAAVIGFRDASDRAEKLKTEAQAIDLIGRATALGDEQLAAAGARKSESMDWGQAFGLWMSTRPRTQPIVDELADIDSMLSARSSMARAFTDFASTSAS